MAKDCRSQTKKPFKKGNTPITTKDQSVNLIDIPTKKGDEGATLPEYKTAGAAGADLYPLESGELKAHGTKRIPTMLHWAIKPGYFGQVSARSSVQAKGISITGTIDADYRGPIDLIVTNHNPYPMFYTKTGKAIAQVTILKFEQAKFIEVDELEPTDRNEGGFGSTDVNAISSHPGKLSFRGTINQQQESFLLDSGADGLAFMGKDRAELHGLKTTNLKNKVEITTAGGKKQYITKVAKNVPYQIQGFSDKTDILIMPNNLSQVILGNHWLSKINPIIDWQRKELTITKGDIIHTLRMEASKSNPLTQVNFIMDVRDFKPEEGDQVFLLHTKEDVNELLGPEEDFYAKK